MADKLTEFVLKLAKRTTEGKVTWERTVLDGVYQAAFPDYTVKLFKRDSRYGEDSAVDVVIQILNSEGELLDEIDDATLSDGRDGGRIYKVMSEMYSLARRRAMGVEAALDSLLDELGPDQPPPDDTPF